MTQGQKIVDWFAESKYEGSIYNGTASETAPNTAAIALSKRIDKALTLRERNTAGAIIEIIQKYSTHKHPTEQRQVSSVCRDIIKEITMRDTSGE
jgi:hypothetical protein